MEKFKFALFLVIAVACAGIIGYWAVTTIEPGDTYVYRKRAEELEEKNRALEEELADLEDKMAENKEDEVIAEEPLPAPSENESPAPQPNSKYQTLIGELNKLISDNIFMKVGSRGTRVGTIQNFMNIYNKTSKKVDNDYGEGTKTDVANFQKAAGLPADGQAGPATYQKMIDWLKKQ